MQAALRHVLRNRRPVGFFLAGWFLFAALWPAPMAHCQDRKWTDAQGRTLDGALLGVESGSAVLQLKAGKRASVALESLCREDRDFVSQWLKQRGPREALPPVAWRGQVSVAQVKISAPEATADDGWLFKTLHYDFVVDEALAPAALIDLGTVAEAAWAWGHALPLRLPDPGGERFLARILRDAAAMKAAGAPEDSAGYFIGRREGTGVLLVPRASLGLEEKDGQLRKGDAYHPRVLIHELGHQLMAEYIPLTPLWFREGFAEHFALPVYRSGRFQSTKEEILGQLRLRFQDYLQRDPASAQTVKDRVPAEAWTVPVAALFATFSQDAALANGTLAEKHRAYLTSLLVFYYFLHLEGDGNARALRHYWQTVAQAAEALRSRPQLDRLPAAFLGWDGTGGIEGLRDHLLPVLFAGRSAADIQADMVRKFRTAGVPIAFSR